MIIFPIIIKNAQKKILFRYEKRKKNVTQCINSGYCICRTLRIPDEYIMFSFDAGIHFSNKISYCQILSMYQFYNEMNKERILEQHKIRSLLYVMIYKNVPQDIVRYCNKSYLSIII